MDNQYIENFKLLIQNNQPYYVIFDAFIYFAHEKHFFMNYYEMNMAVHKYIKPFATKELLDYFEKNIENL